MQFRLHNVRRSCLPSWGFVLSQWSGLADVMLRYRVTGFLKRYGLCALVCAATPVPLVLYNVTFMIAGVCGVRWAFVCIAVLLRPSKMCWHFFLIYLGWNI